MHTLFSSHLSSLFIVRTALEKHSLSFQNTWNNVNTLNDTNAPKSSFADAWMKKWDVGCFCILFATISWSIPSKCWLNSWQTDLQLQNSIKNIMKNAAMSSHWTPDSQGICRDAKATDIQISRYPKFQISKSWNIQTSEHPEMHNSLSGAGWDSLPWITLPWNPIKSLWKNYRWCQLQMGARYICCSWAYLGRFLATIGRNNRKTSSCDETVLPVRNTAPLAAELLSQCCQNVHTSRNTVTETTHQEILVR